MDVRNGHLVSDINEVDSKLRVHYTPVPPPLQAEAERELDGRRQGYINPNRAKGLAAWAAKEKKKRRASTKAQKASRARNRRAR